MNKITLQNLTPHVYYNQSRDFQFIGRLYDVVLNSIKTNTELIYSLPLSENSDEKLIDLMTLTLGFKSKHIYNIKQLTSLCSAFCVAIKNKGNIQSIILAVRALLNAESIKEDLQYSFQDNNTVLNLFISQKLSDINLLKDLLIYILPAGMTYNIIREYSVLTAVTTEITTKDTITLLEGTYVNNSVTKLIGVNSDAKSNISNIEEAKLTGYNISSYPGLIMQSEIYQPKENQQYSITYITDGGKITNTNTTPYSYKTGDTIALPNATKDNYEFTGWFDNAERTGTAIIALKATDVGNKIFYAKWEAR